MREGNGNASPPVLAARSRCEVVALSDISFERLNMVADAFHITNRHTNYQQLLEDASIDAIAVCVPAHSHVQVALDALNAGKHLFIEKPLALRLDEADSLINAIKNSDLKATVGFNLRRHRLI
jgi:myo-inositol 2-dehydrogenase/D-chiro-inositol 1-dehydrogenase